MPPSEIIERDPFALRPDPIQGIDPARKIRIVKTSNKDLPVSSIDQGRWDHSLVSAALNNHLRGQFSLSSELCDTVLGDARVQATLGSRIAALIGSPLSFSRSRDGDIDMARAALDAWQDAWPRMAPSSVLSDVMRFAILMGFALVEIQWDTSAPLWAPVLKVWHPRYVWFDISSREYVVSTQDGPIRITPGDGRWVIVAPDGEHRGWVHGAIRPVGMAWLMRHNAQRDWDRFNERVGQPIVVVNTPAMGDAAADAEFVNGIANMAGSTTVHAPLGVDGQGYGVSLVESGSTAWQNFQGFRLQSNEDIDAAILRQPFSGEGGYAPGERQHGGARQVLLEFDEAGLTEALRRQVARPFAEFNFGDANLAPHTHFEIKPVEDAGKDLAQLESFTRALSALNGSGFEFDARAMARRYGVYAPGLEKTGPGSPYTKATTEVSDGEAVGTGAGAPQQGVIE